MKKSTSLDLSSFSNALSSLTVALSEQKKQPDNLFVRDAIIQRFEYSYELAHKMLKRYLELTESTQPTIDQMSFSTLIRTGAEKGLLAHSWDTWSIYRNARNLTSYTYNESKAIEVLSVIPGFLADANYLLNQLQTRMIAE